MTDPSLHRVCVHFTGCKRHDYDQATNSQLLKFYTRMATVPQPDPTNQKFGMSEPALVGERERVF